MGFGVKILNYCLLAKAKKPIVQKMIIFYPPHQYQAVRVVALDDVLKGENITFLKIDIEGAGYEALAGAENLIKRCKPKIAIAAYHRRKDIWELPMRLLELNGDYTFYLRVYGLNANETVLYAV